MATTFNLSPQDKQSFIDTLVTNINNPEAIRKTAAAYGATAQDLATVTGLPVEQVRQYFLNAGVPMGTLLTGDVQRTIGTEQGRITQQEKADELVDGIRDGQLAAEGSNHDAADQKTQGWRLELLKKET